MYPFSERSKPLVDARREIRLVLAVHAREVGIDCGVDRIDPLRARSGLLVDLNLAETVLDDAGVQELARLISWPLRCDCIVTDVCSCFGR
jgi:hypothetical protein